MIRACAEKEIKEHFKILSLRYSSLSRFVFRCVKWVFEGSCQYEYFWIEADKKPTFVSILCFCVFQFNHFHSKKYPTNTAFSKTVPQFLICCQEKPLKQHLDHSAPLKQVCYSLFTLGETPLKLQHILNSIKFTFKRPPLSLFSSHTCSVSLVAVL